MNSNTMSVIFAYDNESHLNDLTIHRTSASLPFGGRYRLIDFILSNLVAANVTTIGIVTKNNYNSLTDHIRMGRDWNLNRKNSGITVFPPFVFPNSQEIYKGKIDALYTLRGFLTGNKEEYVILSNSNIAFNIDFEEVEKFHIKNNADFTILTHVTDDLNPRKNVIATDVDGRIVEMRLPIASDEGAQRVNLNIYYCKKDILISLIDNAYARGFINFEKDILQKNIYDLKIMSYDVNNYVAVIDRIPTYFKHSMELLNDSVRNELFYNNATIYTKVKDSVPARYLKNANVTNSLIADGCEIDGTVENSILFRGVTVKKGAVIKNSIIMENSVVNQGANVNYTITDKGVTVQEGRQISGFESYPMVIVKNKTI